MTTTVLVWLDCPVCEADVGWSVELDHECGVGEAEIDDQQCECIWPKHVMDEQRDRAAEEGVEEFVNQDPRDDNDAAYEACKNGDHLE